jgi:hypothetical protein
MIWFGRHLHCNIGLNVRFPLYSVEKLEVVKTDANFR